MSPEVFTTTVSAWITAFTAVIELLLTKLGLLAAAYFAWYLTVKKKDAEVRGEIDAIKARQDRHSERLTAVALAVPPAGEVQQVEVVNPPSEPIPVTRGEAEQSVNDLNSQLEHEIRRHA